MIISIGSETAGYLIAAQAQTEFNPSTDAVFASVINDSFAGGGLVATFTGAGGSALVSMAGWVPHWASRGLIWTLYNYCFCQIGCKKIFGQVRSWNHRALDIDTRMGFSVETVVKGVFPNGDMILLSMLKEDCKWIKMDPPKGIIYRKDYDDGRQKRTSSA